MLKAEKFKKEIESFNYMFAVVENKVVKCADLDTCENCEFKTRCGGGKIKWLLEEYEEPNSILTEKEKAYLKNVIEPYGNNTAYVCRFITETLRKEFLSICINVDENSINSFEIPLIHGLKTWYKNMVLDKEYTLEELGL